MSRPRPAVRTALYRLLAANGRLLYVGISGNPDVRWGTHSNNQPWWSEVADRKVEWHQSREVAARAEVVAIKAERPLYNKQHAVPRDMELDGHERADLRMPLDLDAEQAVLGGMLAGKESVAEISRVLTSADFYHPVSGVIFATIVDLHARGDVPDCLTVAAVLTRNGELVRVGGVAYLRTLASAAPSSSGITHHAAVVGEMAGRRRMIEAGRRLIDQGYAGWRSTWPASPAYRDFAVVAEAQAMGLLTMDELNHVDKEPEAAPTPAGPEES